MSTTYTTPCGVTVSRMETGEDRWVPVALTPCCRAAATGTTEGTVCKACHRNVDDLYGSFGEDALEALVARAGCPIPVECVEHAVGMTGV